MKFSCYVDREIPLLLCWQIIDRSGKPIRTGRKILTFYILSQYVAVARPPFEFLKCISCIFALQGLAD